MVEVVDEAVKGILTDQLISEYMIYLSKTCHPDWKIIDSTQTDLGAKWILLKYHIIDNILLAYMFAFTC